MLQTLIGPVTGLLDKFVEDKDQKNALAHEIATMAERHAQETKMAQIAVNQEEAKHRSTFVAGWRPFIGWTCGFALAWHFIITPIVLFTTAIAGFQVPELPTFDMDSLMTVLLGMLGLGGLRTYEKAKGLTK
jgi:phenylpyruvate tautomerase PptA (4-oxalocrotonate tautomerase family)|tara:strand:+ start:4558 stop:4953 length:396 start_codon:yes stop_codon:yes gene_type:complete